MTEQFTPDWWQVEGAEFIAKHPRMILADEMRVRKTGTVLLARAKFKPSSTLIVAGKNAQAAWLTQPPKFGFQAPTIIEGAWWEREKLWKNFGNNDERFCLVTRETLKNDFKAGYVPHTWGMMVTDECHRDTNPKTVNWKTLDKLQYHRSGPFIQVSGSPMRRGPQNLWALLNLIDRKRWSSYWRFINMYMHTVNGQYGMEILGPKNLPGLMDSIKDVFLRRLFKDILPDLPAKNRIFDFQLDLTAKQEKVYNDLNDELLADLPSGGFLVAPTILAKVVRLRQLLVCPAVLDPELGIGASMEAFFEQLEEAEEEHCVVFTPFTGAIPFFEEECLKRGYRQPLVAMGGMHPREIAALEEQFRFERRICICSVSFAEGFDLSSADWAWFLGYEWDPTINLQAEDRLRGASITKPTTYYYPQHRGCIDEMLMAGALDLKADSIFPLLNRASELAKLLRRK